MLTHQGKGPSVSSFFFGNFLQAPCLCPASILLGAWVYGAGSLVAGGLVAMAFSHPREFPTLSKKIYKIKMYFNSLL